MKTNANYNCSQASLYLIADKGWDSFIQFLVVFTAMKAKYVLSYATQRKAEIAAAMKLLDDRARREVAESLGIQLSMDNKDCLAVMQKLKCMGRRIFCFKMECRFFKQVRPEQ
jgi:hypothetical protein